MITNHPKIKKKQKTAVMMEKGITCSTQQSDACRTPPVISIPNRVPGNMSVKKKQKNILSIPRFYQILAHLKADT